MKKGNNSLWQQIDEETYIATINNCECTLKVSYYASEVDTVTAFCNNRLLGFYGSLFEAQQFMEKWCTNWKGR